MSKLIDHGAQFRLRLESAIRASETAATLSEADATGVLNYARNLGRQKFATELNRTLEGAGVPRQVAPVWVGGDKAKADFQRIAGEIGAGLDSALLRSAEIDAVKAAILSRPRKRQSRRGYAAVPLVKREVVRLSSIQKFLSGGKRTIRGLANSGQVDRQSDIVMPKGGSWDLPVPLLWQHKHDQPIGWVRQIEARNDGLWITAELVEGIGKADEAWAMIEAGLVDSYSIGFRPEEWEPLPSGGNRFTKWTLLEISVVTIPADPKAKIQRAPGKANDAAHRGSVRIIPAGGR